MYPPGADNERDHPVRPGQELTQPIISTTNASQNITEKVMVTWVVQRYSGDETRVFNRSIKTVLEGTKHEVHEVRVVPISREVEGGDPIIAGPVVAYGSTAMHFVCQRNKWAPGVWLSEGFTEANTQVALGEIYLNEKMFTCPIREVEKEASERNLEFFFIKPNTGNKEFAGTVADAKRFSGWIDTILSQAWIEKDFEVCVSPVQYVENEWRLPVVDGKIVDYSAYIQNRRLRPERKVLDAVIDVAEEAIKRHNPAPAYVIDVGQVGNDLKIVEYNGFNCAGMYQCDVENVVGAVNDYVEATAA